MARAFVHPPLSRAVGWLSHPPAEVRFGVKYGTAMAVSVWIAFASGLSWGLSIWITVLFVSQPNAGASIKKGLLRIWGSAAAALISIAFYGLFAQQPPLMLASISGAFALAIYGMTGRRHQYAWLVFGFTTSLILCKAMDGSDQIETLAFERASLTALGVLIVFVTDALFWPVRAEEQLRQGLAERIRQLADALGQHLDASSSGPGPSKPGAPPASQLVQQLGLAEQARDEIGVTPARAQALSRIALLLEGLASRVRLLGRESATGSSATAQPDELAVAQLGDELNAALAEASRCLAGDHAPEPFADALEQSLARFEAGGTAHPGLRDVVTLLRRLEEALVGLANDDGNPNTSNPRDASKAAPGAYWERFRPDPIRLQLAFRAGIAGGGVIVAMLSMGWTFDEDLLPMILAPIVAFILAGFSSTRGAGLKTGMGLAMGFLLGWLVADLASVFLLTHLDRMPLSLVYPFAVAGGGGYLIVRGSPLGPLGALFAVLTALLPIFIGDAPPDDVDTAYSLVCGLFLGLAAGMIGQRFLWPRTAMQIFTERAAAQLDLCLRTLPGTDRATPDRAGLVTAYAKQLTMLGQLHAQAHAEPVERALDDERRGELLALLQDLFDACLGADRTWSAEEEALPKDAEAALVPLRPALHREANALVASVTAAAAALRGAEPGPGSGLAEARAAVESQLDALRARPDIASRALVHLDSPRLLLGRQIAIEGWIADWHRAQRAERLD